MGQTAKPTRHNRPITVDFHDETTYFELLSTTKAFVECVLAFILSLGFQLLYKGSCSEGKYLTAMHITSGSGWAGSPSGVSSARGAKRCSRSCRILSCAIAR
jgi:hypothetical protein